MNNFNISYNIIGEGEPIIFIHGIGSRKDSWRRVINELKDDYKCITYDLRGHGRSIIEYKEFFINDLVEDLEKLRTYLNVDKIHLVGHSLGGIIGPSYVKKYQLRVKSVTLLSTAAFRSKKSQKKILDIINCIEDRGLEAVIPILVNRWFTDDFVKKNPDIVNKRIIQVKETPLNTFLNVFRIYALTEMSPWLHEINIPSFIMTGENDTGCNPVINKKIADSLSISKLFILDNLKHAITLESPKLIGKKIKNFISNI